MYNHSSEQARFYKFYLLSDYCISADLFSVTAEKTDHFLESYTIQKFCDIENRGKKYMDSGITMCCVSLKDCIFLQLHFQLFSFISFPLRTIILSEQPNYSTHLRKIYQFLNLSSSSGTEVYQDILYVSEKVPFSFQYSR